jgi:hypothetical protein
MINNFKRGLNGDYGVRLTPNKLKVLCEIDWSAFGVGWPLEGSLDKTVINKVYRVIVKEKKKPNTQENEKSQEAKTGRQKPDSVVYLNSGSNLLGRLRRNQNLSVLMDVPSLHIFTQNWHHEGGLKLSTN